MYKKRYEVWVIIPRRSDAPWSSPGYYGLVGSWPEDEHFRLLSDPEARYA